MGSTNVEDVAMNLFTSNNNGFVAGINNMAGQINLIGGNMLITVSNSSALAGTAYAINNSGIMNMSFSNIEVRDVNSAMPVSVTALQNNGQVSYQRGTLIAEGFSPATVLATNGAGSFINLGNMYCSIEIDGVETSLPCP